MIMEDILRFCGYNSAYNLIKDHMTQAELSDLLEDLVNSPGDAADFIKEEVERIAEKYFEWGDYEKAKADEDDAAYQRYRDGD